MTLTDRLGGARSSLAYKAPCKVATTANITLSGEQTIDDVAVVNGDRVLVKDQTDAAENGIYEVRSNAWVRAADFSSSRDITQGTRMNVVQGTVGQGEYELTTSGDIVIGTTELTIAYWSLGSASFTSLEIGVQQDVPGSIEVFGGGSSEAGGNIYIYRGNDQSDNMRLYYGAGDDVFRMQRSGSSAPDFGSNSSGQVVLAVESGQVNIGSNDTTRAEVNLYGDGASETIGAVLNLYQSADHDDTTSAGELWRIQANQGGLWFRFADNTNAVKFNGDGTVEFLLNTVSVTNTSTKPATLRIEDASDPTIHFADGTTNGNMRISYEETQQRISFQASSSDGAYDNIETAAFYRNGNVAIGGLGNPSTGAGCLSLINGTAPTTSVTDGVILYSEDSTGSAELKVRDEAGNVTTLSPHNFSLTEPSEPLAWSYHSVSSGHTIEVDMLRLARSIEALTGEKHVFISTGKSA